MSVKKKDRHVSKNIALEQSRKLMEYLLILTRPREFNRAGKQTQRPGILGEGQPFQVFGLDLIKCGKSIHGLSYQASLIKIKDKETLEEKNNYHKKAIQYCDSIFRQIDFCIYQYAKDNKKKINSFEHLAQLTRTTKQSLQERINRDILIYKQNYAK